MNDYYLKNNCDAKYQTTTSMGDYYKKSDSDAKFQTIAGMSNYYNKSQIDTQAQQYVTQAGITLLLSAYPTFGYVSANYYTQTQILNLISGFEPVTSLTKLLNDNYYTKSTVDNYIDAKIDASYVLEMMYNAGGHQYFIAVDPTTSTTDAQFIICLLYTSPSPRD